MNTQNTNTKTRKRLKQTTSPTFKNWRFKKKNKSEDKTALTSELSLICNDRHSEKVNFCIFSGYDETLLKTKSLLNKYV